MNARGKVKYSEKNIFHHNPTTPMPGMIRWSLEHDRLIQGSTSSGPEWLTTPIWAAQGPGLRARLGQRTAQLGSQKQGNPVLRTHDSFTEFCIGVGHVFSPSLIHNYPSFTSSAQKQNVYRRHTPITTIISLVYQRWCGNNRNNCPNKSGVIAKTLGCKHRN